MKAMSADKYSNAKVGQNVRLKVSDIDDAKTDPKSIIAVVADVKDNSDIDDAKTDPKSIIAVVADVKDNEFYQWVINIGVLRQLYTQNQFISCSEE
ncbi:hypothetical protein QE152_g5532 [Popillia japonica]|uniref:Uncharacterized protein n=1 Tax=Popillia japonica TaxID=7064 RepID=A0AAW1MMS9_POPJA